jgi:hypothetical protein
VRFLLVIPALLLALLAFSACSEDDEDEITLEFVLGEWSIDGETEEARAGDIRFDLNNEGPDEDHELVIIRTDFAPGDLPTEDDGSVDEGASGVNVIGEISDFEPDSKSSGTFTLAEGAYVLICNLVSDVDGTETSHYQQGMVFPFTATED